MARTARGLCGTGVARRGSLALEVSEKTASMVESVWMR